VNPQRSKTNNQYHQSLRGSNPRRRYVCRINAVVFSYVRPQVSLNSILRPLAGFVSTLGHADFDIRDEVYRKGFGELINVLGVDLLWLVLA
jgi:hypothetical protein